MSYEDDKDVADIWLKNIKVHHNIKNANAGVWIDPSGKAYVVEFGYHENWQDAYIMSNNLGVGSLTHVGWILISIPMGVPLLYRHHDLNQAQINILFDWCQTFGINYDTMIERGREHFPRHNFPGIKNQIKE